jgi:hypothetical protein
MAAPLASVQPLCRSQHGVRSLAKGMCKSANNGGRLIYLSEQHAGSLSVISPPLLCQLAATSPEAHMQKVLQDCRTCRVHALTHGTVVNLQEATLARVTVLQ